MCALHRHITLCTSAKITFKNEKRKRERERKEKREKREGYLQVKVKKVILHAIYP